MQGIGMTVECPDEIKEVPRDSSFFHESSNYWILDDNIVSHHGRTKEVQFNIRDLKVGDTVGASVHEDGILHFHLNGIDAGICWDERLPTNQAMYGIVDVYGRHKKIRSLFHYGKYSSVLT